MFDRFTGRTAALLAIPFLLAAPRADADHIRVFVLTGQSNSLGTTNGTETDLTPGSDPADAHVKFWWHNVADATTSLGDSGGVFTSLQQQQGGYYAGSATHWGPEIAFGRTIYRAGVRDFAIVKASRGGGGNTNWSKVDGGHMYQHVVDTVTAATTALTNAGDTFEIAGLLYLQGESDTTTEANIADTRFLALIDNLRTDLPNAAGMHGVIGGIAAAGTAKDTVRARHESIATATSYIDFFPNLDLQAETTDGLHFDKAAKLRIGGRYARAFLDAGVVDRHYGNLVFVGDSITQGGNGDHPSYRYQVFKRLAERGVPIDQGTGYKFTGSVTGPYQNSTLTTPDVNGQSFENVHDGHYGWRASWINARVRLPSNRRDANRGEGSLLNWTAQASPQEYLISSPDATVAYPDPTASGTGNTGTTYVPDTACVMIGINDLGDNNFSANQVVADIATIIDQLRAANANVRIFINQLLYTNQTQAMRDAVDAVNAQLPTLADTKNAASSTSPVWIVDANTDFNPALLTYDTVHPNAAGEEQVGDRIAAAFGLIEDTAEAPVSPPPHDEEESGNFGSRFEGNEIWDGAAFVNAWAQVNTLNKSLPETTDLQIVHPSTNGRWIEGTNSGWAAVRSGSWTFETRLKCNANANGFILWCGVGSNRILMEIHGDRTRDHSDGGQTFNNSHDNLDGNFHIFRIAHDAPNARYHVFRDGVRLSPLDGVPYDQIAADGRLILGDYTSGTFGDNFDITIDHVRFTAGAYLPPGVDTDADGMPDAWEYQYFYTLTGADPNGNPDEDGATNVEEFQNGTHPLVADTASSNPLPVHLLTGGGNALGTSLTSTLHSPAPGEHPAEQSGGVWFHDGTGWKTLDAAGDGSFGPEIAFARLLWDAGYRDFGIVKSAATGGGNTLWQKPGGTAWLDLVATANAAASSPPAGYDGVTFRSLLYVQGETNDTTEADAAGTRFSELLANLRSDLPGAATIEGVIGEIGGSGTDRDTTRARHASLAGSDPDVGLARATGVTTHNLDGLGIHYDADGLYLLGSRMAAEAIRMDLAGPKPLPAWSDLRAWFIADHGRGIDNTGAVIRLGSLHSGEALRDLSRRVGLPTYPFEVTSGSGQSREALRFDGTNDLWSNSTTEFGAISGARTVALVCRVTKQGDGFLFDGSTSSGRTRARVGSGSWQAGCSTSTWDSAETTTTTRDAGVWQQHVFTYQPDGSGGTTVTHWIDGTLAATVTDPQTANLGGFILGSNGGSPFSRLAADVAEVVVYDTALDASAVAELTNIWNDRWGTITGPPFSATVVQNPREIPRFGLHDVLEIRIGNDVSGATQLDEIRVQLAPGTRERIERVVLLDGGGSILASVDAPGVDEFVFPVTVPLLDDINIVRLAAVPERHAPLGSTLDASVTDLVFSGANAGNLTPSNHDPAGEITLALVPLFQDVVRSGDLGITTFRIPGIVCDSDGVLHTVYDHRYTGGSDLPADIDVGYSRSSDGGATWSTSQVILDYDSSESGSLGNGVGDPAILHDPVTDTLWVAALWSFGNNGWAGSGPGTDPVDTGQYVLTKSTDGGNTWSAPINITAAVKDDPNWRLVFQGPGHGLAMRDGTLVFPSQYRDASGVSRVCSVFSSDHGASWDFGSGVPTSSPQTNENTVCELDDGRLLFSMRTPSGSNGQRAWIRYLPGGATPMRDGTWEDLYRLPSVPDPVCQGSVIQWTSTHRGDPAEWIVSGNPGSSSSRVNFTLRVSPDGGDSWPVSRSLYAGSSAYSSICILPDKSIGVFFEKDNYTRITFARVEAEWLMDPETDTDSDGMPDAWERLVGLNPSIDDSQIDSDGDGISNASEHAAGTHPLDDTSFFATSSFTAGETLDLSWRSVPGRSYAIEQSFGLSGWEAVPGFGSVDAAGNVTSASLPGDGSPRRFLRVRALP
ncbi:MAG: exo-alpha-sialidase [Akkermansiaceae bacterium]|nr:exo-alpha-sialidase [Akkermansiaceae bacterium]